MTSILQSLSKAVLPMFRIAIDAFKSTFFEMDLLLIDILVGCLDTYTF